MNKIPIDQVVIVEGKYDKITLENIIDAMIIPCDGFGIFKNKEHQAALKSLAKERGAILLTDSDRAGGVIRSHLQRLLQGCELYVLYIPAVEGKEKRKTSYSKDGYLGVEGTEASVLRTLFEEFRAEPVAQVISAADLYACGITGVRDAKGRKEQLLRSLNLPPHLSNNALLRELNRRFDHAGFIQYINEQ